MLGVDEPLADGVREQPEQPVVVVGLVQHPDRLSMDAELRPRQHFQQLLERPEAARQRDESVGQLDHDGFPLVHAADDAQLRDARVRELAARERARNDADDPAAGLHHRVGERAHEADRPAAVYQLDPARGQLPSERAGDGRVLRARAFSRAAEHADAPDQS